MIRKTSSSASIIVISACLLFSSSCAPRPENIAAARIDASPFQKMTCDQLAVEHRSVIERYNEAARGQRRAASTDAVGVFFIGVPISSISGGNRRDQIATLRGQDNAIRKLRHEMECPEPF